MSDLFLTKYDGAILGPIAKVLGWILNGIYNLLDTIGIANVGICIVIFTILINGLMIPLTIKQQKFSRLQAMMQPELTAIQNKYKGKKDQASMQLMQMEQQELYQKYGTSPTGGCLPMLITFPIIFALYRVIQNVPAYVDKVKDIYNTAAVAIAKVPGYADTLLTYIAGQEGAVENAITLQTSGWGDDLAKALQTPTDGYYNHIIDELAQFSNANWDSLQQSFAGNDAVVKTLADTQAQLGDINNFLGFSIIDRPALASITILIPILAIVTQFVSTRMMMASTDKQRKANRQEPSPMEGTMKTMNTVMPVMSGLFTLMFPIGIGIYWITGNLFRMIQQIFVNRHMDNVDMEEVRQKGIEKQRKKQEKREKRGLPTAQTMQEIAKKRTSTISERSAAVNRKGNLEGSGKDEPVSKSRGTVDAKPNSITAIANMMNGSKDDKMRGKK